MYAWIDRLLPILRQRLQSWREEPWPLLPWREMPGSYRLSILAGTLLPLILAIIAVTAAGAPLGAPDPVVLLAGLTATLYVGRRIARSGEVQSEEFEMSVAVALAIAGRVEEACICAVFGGVVKAIRKPIVLHAAVYNVAQGVAVVLACGATRQWLLEGRWDATAFAGALAMLLLVEAALRISLAAVIATGGYGDLRETLRAARTDVLRAGTSIFPLAIAVGVVIGLGDPWLLPLLVLPRSIYGATLAYREEAVQAGEAARLDPLTGLLNRGVLLDRIAVMLAAAPGADSAPAGEGRRGWLVAIGMEGFDQVVERHGQLAGEHALTTAAEQLRQVVRQQDACGRSADDRFVVALHADQLATVESVATRICDGIDTALGFLGIQASLGIHELLPGDDAKGALARTELELHASSRSQAIAPGGSAAALAYWEAVAQDCGEGGDEHGQAQALYQVYWANRGEAAVACLRQIVLLGPERNGWAARAAAALALRDGELQVALAYDEAALEIAAARGDRVLEMVGHLGLAHRHRLGGDLDRAASLLQHAVDLATTYDSPGWGAEAFTKLVDVHLGRCDIEAALAAAGGFIELARASRASGIRIAAAAAHGRALAAAGHTRDAWDALEPVVAAAALGGAGCELHVEAALVAVQRGDLEAAQDLAGTCERIGCGTRTHQPCAGGGALMAIRTLIAAAAGEASVLPVSLDGRIAADPLEAEVRLWLVRLGASVAGPAGGGTGTDASSTLPEPRQRLVAREATARAARDADGLRAVARLWRRAQMLAAATSCEVLAGEVAAGGDTDAWEVVEVLVAERQQQLDAGMVLLATRTGDVLAQLAGTTREAEDDQHEAWLVQGLSVAGRSELRSLVSMARFDRGHVFLRGDRDATRTFLLYEGRVRLYRRLPGGRELTVALLDAGDAFGNTGVGEVDGFELWAEALAPGRVGLVASERLGVLAERHPQLGRNLVQHAYRQLRRASQMVERCATWPAQARVAALLVELADRYGTPTLDGSCIIGPHFRQHELAAMVGLNRQTFAASASRLRELGLLTNRGRRLIVCDVAALAALGAASLGPGSTTAGDADGWAEAA